MADAKSAARQVEQLQDQLGRLFLITEAMWSLIKGKLDVDDTKLGELMKEIDLRDGKLDGKANPVPDLCLQCSRPVSVRSNICPYCGIRVERSSPF